MEENHGKAFNFLTGEFTAPMVGLYRFGLSVIGKSDGHGYFTICVTKNGRIDRRFVDNTKVAYRLYTSVAGSWEMILFEGDRVALLMQHGTIVFQYLDTTDHVHFYGKLETEKTPFK